MKFNFKISNIQIGDVAVGGVEVSTELSINEMVAIRKESESFLKKMPEYLEDLAEGMRTFEKLDEEFETKHDAQMMSDLVKRSVMAKMAKEFNK